MASKRTFALALLLAGWAASVAPAAEVQTGDPQLKSIEAITFGPEGLLLIGDGRGAQVVAVQTGDTTPTKWVDTTKIDDLRGHLAARLGTTAKGIEILKMAVNPASQVAYLAVRKLDGKQDLILTVDGAGKVREFAFDKVKFTRYTLPPGEKSPITKVTDITYADGRILLAAQPPARSPRRLSSSTPRPARTPPRSSAPRLTTSPTAAGRPTPPSAPSSPTWRTARSTSSAPSPARRSSSTR